MRKQTPMSLVIHVLHAGTSTGAQLQNSVLIFLMALEELQRYY